MNTVEDYLELLVGLREQSKFDLERSDISILQSIGRQVFKGVALTDRQLSLVKEKLLKYKDQFTALGYDIDFGMENLRMPLREIDRSKYITICKTGDEIPLKGIDYDTNWIRVRFPFSKKLILIIESIISSVSRNKYHHSKGSHEHYFMLCEKTTFEVVSKLKDKNFEIDEELLNEYERLEYMNNNKQKYIPGIYNFKLKNLNDRATKYMLSSVGEPSIENLALYKDRQELLGLHHFDELDLEKSLNNLTILSKKIATRKNFNVFVQNETYTINNVAESILELDRFPLLVVLPETDPLSYLHQVHCAFNGFIEFNQSSVLFRLDNDKNSEFNDYIKKHKLNNPLDNNTKIVYISTNNIPKPLIKSDWKPSAALMLSSARPHSRIGVYTGELDLVIQYDNNPSQMMRRDLDIL